MKLQLAFKGRDFNGQPLCFDFSSDRELLAVGFEDDSFIVYAIDLLDKGFTFNVIPVMRGVGHKNFVSCLRFDNYFQKNHQNYLKAQKQEDHDIKIP